MASSSLGDIVSRLEEDKRGTAADFGRNFRAGEGFRSAVIG